MGFELRQRPSQRAISRVGLAANRARSAARRALAVAAAGTYLAFGTTAVAAGVAPDATGSRGDMRLALAASTPIDKSAVTAGCVS